MIAVYELENHVKDVILQNGAKHRCIDATIISELPKTEIENGYWIVNDKLSVGMLICSQCGRCTNITMPDTTNYYANQFKFCPYCGAKMDKEKIRHE